MAFELKDYSFDTVLQRLITKLDEDSNLTGIGKFLYFSVMNIILRIVAWAVSFLAEYDNEIFQELHLVTCTNFEHGRVKAKGLNYTPSRRTSAMGTLRVANDDTFLTNPTTDFNIPKWTKVQVGGKDYLTYSDSFTLSSIPSENLVVTFEDESLVPTEIITEPIDFIIARYPDASMVEELPDTWGKKYFTFELYRYKSVNYTTIGTGTLSVTNSLKEVVGTATTFLSDFSIGDAIVIENVLYIVESVATDLSLQISVTYPQATLSGISDYSKLSSTDINAIINEGELTAVKDFPYVGRVNVETVSITNGTNLLVSTGNAFTENTSKVIIYVSPSEYYIEDVLSYTNPTQVVLSNNWIHSNLVGGSFNVLINVDEFYNNVDFPEISYTNNYTGITAGDVLPVDKKYEDINFGGGSGIKTVVTDSDGVPVHNGSSDTNLTSANILGSNVIDNPQNVGGEPLTLERDGLTLPTYNFPTGTTNTPAEIVSNLTAHFGTDFVFSISSGRLFVEHSIAGASFNIQCTTSPIYIGLPTSLVSGTDLIANGGLPQDAPYVLADAYELTSTSDILECVTEANKIPLDSTDTKIPEPFNSHNKYLAVEVTKETVNERIIVDSTGNALDSSNEIIATPYDHRNIATAVLVIIYPFNESIYCVHDDVTTFPLDFENNHLVAPFDTEDYYNAKRLNVSSESYNVPSDGLGVPQRIVRDLDGNYVYTGGGAIDLEPLNSPYDEQELYTTDILTYLYYKDTKIIQGEIKELFYNSTGNKNESIIIDNPSVENDNLVISVAFSKDINGNPVWEDYTLVDSFYNSDETDNHYKLEPFDFMQKLKITFPDGIKGKKLPIPSELIPNDNIRTTFIETGYTNAVVTNKDLVASFEDANLNELYATNISVLIGASDNETLEGIQEDAPKVFQKGSNAIDYDGWKIAIKSYGGIQEVSVIGELDTLVEGQVANIEMANYVKIFLVPYSGIDLDETFYNELRAFLLNEKAITDIPIFDQIKYINVVFTIENRVSSNTSIEEFELDQKNFIEQDYKLSHRIIGDNIVNAKVIQDLKNRNSGLIDVDVALAIEQSFDMDTEIVYITHLDDVDVIDMVIDSTYIGTPQTTLNLNSTSDFSTGSLDNPVSLFSAFNFNFLTGELNFTLNTDYVITDMKFVYKQKDIGTNTDNITIDNTMIAISSSVVNSSVFD